MNVTDKSRPSISPRQTPSQPVKSEARVEDKKLEDNKPEDIKPAQADRVEVDRADEPQAEDDHPLLAGLLDNYGQKPEAPAGEMSKKADEQSKLDKPGKAGQEAGTIGKQLTEAAAEAERVDQVQEARESGKPTTITNGRGQEVEVQVSQTEGNDEHDVYNVTVNGRKVKVEVPKGEDPDTYLARVSDYYSQQPENLQGAVNHVVINAGDDPNGNAAATGANGTITFYGGQDYLNGDVFDHEFGHNIADSVEDRQAGLWERIREGLTGREQDDGWNAYIPDGYNEAIEKDKNPISEYGQTNGAEDFGEAYRAYMDATAEGPEAVEEFRRMYPNRARIIEEIIREQDDLSPSEV